MSIRPTLFAERRPTDREMIDAAARRCASGEYDGAHMNCFSKAEADDLREYARVHHPGLKITFSWMEPRRPGD